MKKCKLLCKVITPMFMTGADTKIPELRPSEFKGMMRFWWRAIRCEENIEKLKKEEAKIFGGTEQGAGKSKIKLILKSNNFSDTQNYIGNNLRSEENLIWKYDRKQNRLVGQHRGIGYLFYSVLSSQGRNYIKPGYTFNLEILSFDESFLKPALASLWASIYFGGFGTRARRGAGNIVVENISGETFGLDFIVNGENSEEILSWLKENLKKCFEFITGDSSSRNFVSSYSNLSLLRVIMSKRAFNSWIHALNDIGNFFADFRQEHKHEFLASAVFGLPVMHRSKKKVIGLVRNKKINRRGSPLIIKILKNIKNKYFWMVLRLTGEFLKESGVVKFEKFTNKPDYRLIDEFWNKLKRDNYENILSQPQILTYAVDKIVKQISPTKIILFGSRARGDAHKNADIDIAIDTNKPLSSLDVIGPFDFIKLEDELSEDLKNRIKKEGITLYERAN